MRWFILLFAALLLISGCAQQQAPVFIEDRQCNEELVNLQDSNKELSSKISDLEQENSLMKKQLDDYYFTEIKSDIDLLDWNVADILKGMSLYNPKFESGGWWTYFYDLGTKNYYYQEAEVFPEDPFFQLRFKNSGQEFNVSKIRIINIALGNRTLGEKEWASYLSKVLIETQVDRDLTCYQQNACRQIKVIKCNKNNQKLYIWSEGTNLFMSRDDDSMALDTFERFYCTKQ